MGNVVRHMHLFVFCRVHPGEQELAPLGDGGGVYMEMGEIEEVLDDLARVGEVEIQSDIPLIEFRGPGVLAIQTTQANDERSLEFGGDGRCHRVFTQVWCIGDPDECRESIQFAARMKALEFIPHLLESDDPESRDLGQRGLLQLIADMAGAMDIEDVAPRMPAPPKNEFGVGYANESIDDLFDFGGFDEPKGPKRLN